MSGLCGFGDGPGMRRLPRPGLAGGVPGLVSVRRLPGSGSRGGSGHRGSNARDGCGRGVRSSVPCRLTVRALPGRTPPARGLAASRPAARYFPAPPRARQAASSRIALPLRRASVVTTAKPGSDDAGRPTLHGEETRSRRGFSRLGPGDPKKCRYVPRGENTVFFAPWKKVSTPQCLHLVRKTELEPSAVRGQ